MVNDKVFFLQAVKSERIVDYKVQRLEGKTLTTKESKEVASTDGKLIRKRVKKGQYYFLILSLQSIQIGKGKSSQA